MVKLRVRIRFSVWLVGGYAHVFFYYFPLSFSLSPKKSQSPIWRYSVAGVELYTVYAIASEQDQIKSE